jgi:hypothetical protein
MSKTPSTMAQAPMKMARTTAVAIGANKAMRPKMIPRTPRIMAKIQILLAKLGKPAAVFDVADMSRILSALAEQHGRTCALGYTRYAWAATVVAKFGP